jgi:hypothetical protein
MGMRVGVERSLPLLCHRYTHYRSEESMARILKVRAKESKGLQGGELVGLQNLIHLRERLLMMVSSNCECTSLQLSEPVAKEITRRAI